MRSRSFADCTGIQSVGSAGVLMALFVALAALAGCANNLLGAASYYLSPPHVEKAEFTFPEGSKVLVFIDPRDPRQDNPVFAKALVDRVTDYFRDYKSPATLVPHESLVRLKQSNPDFATWSVQRVGREAGADYVLRLHVDQLQGREAEFRDVISPLVRLRMSVIAADHPEGRVRVWPDDGEGREVVCRRQSSDASSPEALDIAMAKLARDTAWHVARPFFDVNLEDRPSVER